MRSPRVYKASGIVLKRRNIGETDRLVTIFTKEYGKIVVIARGIRKITSRRAPHLEIFSHVSLLLHKGKVCDIVTEVTTVHLISSIRKHLPFIQASYYMCELIDVLTPEKQEMEDVFYLLDDAISEIDDGRFTDLPVYLEEFALSLLRKLGFLPIEKTLRSSQIQPFIEHIVEKRMKTYQFLTTA
ncbi:DNA repair protein RecO [Candidatus Gottesmanbacteria bacterium]|nr:DNA repair protein RecO [Candidatus Gottesmanbacteria bacterium]